MGLKFRLRGLAETFIDEICCPKCNTTGHDDTKFTAEHTKVTPHGIVVIVKCNACEEIFVPTSQRLGVINPSELRKAVEKDSSDTGEAILENLKAVKVLAEKMNAERKDELQ